jgi:hypothetical protein
MRLLVSHRKVICMRTPIAALCSLLLASLAFAQAPDEKGEDLKYRIGNDFFQTMVDSVTPEGEVVVKFPGDVAPGGPRIGGMTVTEGYYLALLSLDPTKRSVAGANLARVQVTEVMETGIKLQFGAEAAKKLGAGELLMVFRPQGATTAQLKAAPQLAPIEDAKDSTLGLTKGSAEDFTASQNNLKQIGLAMHNFHDVYGFMPPAVIYGPDGKPWHSWRVLLLPFLEQRELYDEYRLDEPWDGPNNEKLLERIPSVYRDPVHGSPMDYNTHYAAVTGKGMAFPSEGMTFDGTPGNLLTSDKNRGAGRTRLAAFRDGTSNSLLVGSVSPGRKIPWMKPEDVAVVAGDAPVPGKDDKKGFAAPYESKRGNAGLFVFADGSVVSITSDVKPEMFNALLSISDGIPVDRGSVPGIDPSAGRATMPVFRIVKGEKGVVAEFSQEEAPPPDPSAFRGAPGAIGRPAPVRVRPPTPPAAPPE